ncbi:MAG: hypothetical protein HUK22_01360, partial [Thermoguttaceae bacterium]|nr:hypothetical protein [Thermoguttaceae bacterium]
MKKLAHHRKTKLRAIAASLALSATALVFGAPQEPAPAPAPAANAAPADGTPTPPAEPTEEEKLAALRKIGAATAEQIPNPVTDPAGAVQLLADYEDALANPDPPEPAPSLPLKLTDFDPAKSYSRLLYQAVADRVGLTEAQRQRVSELMTKRSQSLAAAPKEEWNKLTLDSEAELKAVLTEEQ